MDSVCGEVVQKFQALKATIINELGFYESMKAFNTYRDTTEIGALDLAYKEAENPEGDHFPSRNIWLWIDLEADKDFVSYLLMKLNRFYLEPTRMSKENYYDDYSKKGIVKIILPLSYFEFAYLTCLDRKSISYKRFIYQTLRQIKYPKLLPLNEEIRKEVLNALKETTD